MGASPPWRVGERSFAEHRSNKRGFALLLSDQSPRGSECQTIAAGTFRAGRISSHWSSRIAVHCSRLPRRERCWETPLRTIHGESPFRTVAMVLLPDHLHAIWQLPSNDCDYSTRWQRIKARFTTDLRCSGYRMPKLSLARQNRGERGIWQRRFWEHVIRDEAELEAYFDYIHWNPVKHGYVRHPAEWESTTYHRHVRSGHYPKTWGSTEPSTLGCIDDQLCE